MSAAKPAVVLLCHEADRIDAEGLAAWLASSMNLVGIVALRERAGVLAGRARREIRRVGLLRFLDVVAFRLYYRARLEKADAAWIDDEVSRLRARYPTVVRDVPRLVATSPNTPEVRAFVRRLAPDLMIARCKVLLKPDLFTVPPAGTWVLHPGICPEYRNAHGCFWALVRRDLDRVGMTLLRIDAGIDTGPIHFQGGYKLDELRESHIVIQYRVVLENLPEIEAALLAAWKGDGRPISIAGRHSAIWGKPWLTAYLRWKRAAREATR